MNVFCRFVVTLVSVTITSSCFAQSLPGSTPADERGLTWSDTVDNCAAMTKTAHSGVTASIVYTRPATLDLNRYLRRHFGFVTPLDRSRVGDSSDLISPPARQSNLTSGLLAQYRAAASLDPAKPGFEASIDYPLIGNERIYNQLLVPSRTGKLIRMINSIADRFDQATVDTGQSIRDANMLSGDTSFAVSQRLALTGIYQHNARQHLDSMAFGVAFILK